MNLQVKGRNIAVTEALRAYVDEKLSKLGKNLNSASTMEVELFCEKNPSIAENQVAEVTIFTKGPVLRAKGAHLRSLSFISGRLKARRIPKSEYASA